MGVSPRKCRHGKQYYSCIKCPGPGVCEHKRRRSRCRECKGSEICEHDIVRNSCRKCKGSRFCIHNRQHQHCKVCGGFEVLAKNLLYGARRRAREANIPISITKKDILELIGNGICPVFGTPYNLNSIKSTKDSATIDRLLCCRGYTKKNCAVISMLANTIKTNANSKQILRVAMWLAKREEELGY